MEAPLGVVLPCSSPARLKPIEIVEPIVSWAAGYERAAELRPAAHGDSVLASVTGDAQLRSSGPARGHFKVRLPADSARTQRSTLGRRLRQGSVIACSLDRTCIL